eukprot:5004205-Amphidinium_carterae.1
MDLRCSFLATSARNLEEFMHCQVGNLDHRERLMCHHCDSDPSPSVDELKSEELTSSSYS